MRQRLLVPVLVAAALAASATAAFATEDRVQFGNAIRVGADQTVHDAVCFFCGVEDNGTVEGDVVVFFGNVHVNGKANHDVVTFFGNVTVRDGSSIGQDLVNFFGRTRLGDNVSVGKDIVSMFGSFEAAPTASNGGERVAWPGWLFWTPLLVFFLVIFLIVHELRARRRHRLYMAGYPYQPPRA